MHDYASFILNYDRGVYGRGKEHRREKVKSPRRREEKRQENRKKTTWHLFYVPPFMRIKLSYFEARE